MYRQLNIFVASSLQHSSSREIIARVMEEEILPDVRIRTYLHERNGVYNLRPGIGSQQIINAEALTSDGFILYVGDYVGQHTVNEFCNILKGGDRTTTFLFVVHNTQEHVSQPVPEGFITWEEFSAQYMTGLDGCVSYYEVQTDNDTLEHHIRRIRNEILHKSFVPLAPSQLDYNAILSDGQRAYRTDHAFYYERDLDGLLAERSAHGFAPLTIVSGQPLSGKTRALTRALAGLDTDVRIHFLRGSGGRRVIDRFLSLNCSAQFPIGSRNILFIDEIDCLLLSTDKNSLASVEISGAMDELMSVATDGSGRLCVIGTTNISPDLLTTALASVPHSSSWLSNSTERICVSTLSRVDMQNILREMRSLNLIDRSNTLNITDGMPIGSLFVRLDKVRQTYDTVLKRSTRSLDLSRVFDAVKTIGLWKNSSRNDFDLLVDYVNNVHNLHLAPEDIYGLLKEAGTLATVETNTERTSIFGPVRTTYSFSVEDLIREQVFRFMNQSSSGEMTADDYIGALCSAIGYVCRVSESGNQSDIILFRDLTKIFLSARYLLSDVPDRYRELLYEVEKLYPVDMIISRHQFTDTLDGGKVDWVDAWFEILITEWLNTSTGYDKAIDVYRRRRAVSGSTQPILSAILAWEREKDSESVIWQSLLDSDGHLSDDYAQVSYFRLKSEILTRLCYPEALDWLMEHDYMREMKTSLPDWTRDSVDTYRWIQRSLRHDLSLIVSKIGDTEQVFELIEAIRQKNEKLIHDNGMPIYKAEAEKLLTLISSRSWFLISLQVPSAHLMRLFDLLFPIDVGAVTIETVRPLVTAKRTALNTLIGSMSGSDALLCWERMEGLRDSFTLRAVLDKMKDFAAAKGLFDSFMSSEVGKRIRVTHILLNPLLRTARNSGDLTDAEESFHRFGLLPQDAHLTDIRDEYTMGILYNIEKLPYRYVLDMVSRQRDESRTRTVETIGCIIYKAPNFEFAHRLMFDDYGKSFFTDAERSELRDSPVILSMLFSKVSSYEEAHEARQLLDGLILQWDRECRLNEIMGHKDGNIISMLFKNKFLMPAFQDCHRFLDRMRTLGVVVDENIFIDRSLAQSFCRQFKDPHSPELVNYLNNLVMRYSGADRKQVWRNMRLRANPTDIPLNKSLDLEYVEVYPWIADDGQWTLRSIKLSEFFINMLSHRFAHPSTLNHILLSYARKMSVSDREAKNEMINDIDRIVNIAVRNRTYLNQKGYITARNSLALQGYELSPEIAEYSLMQEVSNSLCNGNIDPETAERMVRNEELRTKRSIHRSQAYYDSIITWERKSGRYTLSEMIRRIKSLPDGVSFSYQMFFTLSLMIRNVDDLIMLDKAYDGPPLINRYAGLLSKDFPRMPVDVAEDIFKYTLGYSDGDIHPEGMLDNSMISSLLIRLTSLPLSEIIAIAERYDLQFNEQRFFHLFRFVNYADDFRMISRFMPAGGWNANLVNGMLNRIYDRDRNIFKQDLFEYFNTPDTVAEWHDAILTATSEEYAKLVGKLRKSATAYRKSPDICMRRFAAFCHNILYCK